MRYCSIVLLLLLSACSLQGADSYFLRAERLWSEKKYEAAVREYDRVLEKAPKSRLGPVAQYRAARTEMLFLNRPESALKRFQTLLSMKVDVSLKKKSAQAVAELLGPRLNRWSEAFVFYDAQEKEASDVREKNEWWMRKGTALIQLQRYDQAAEVFDEIRKDPKSVDFHSEAAWQYAIALFTQTEERSTDRTQRDRLLKQAASLFESIEKTSSSKSRKAEAAFLLANCLEEMDRVSEALVQYQNAKEDHPNPAAVEIRIQRVQERIHSKKR